MVHFEIVATTALTTTYRMGKPDQQRINIHDRGGRGDRKSAKRRQQRSIEMEREPTNEALFQQIIQQRDAVARLARETAVTPLAIANAEVRSVIAYTNTDFDQPWVDEKVIQIPQGWAYFNHAWHETTGLGNKKVYDPWMVRDPHNASRIIEVHIKVEAFARWFARSWVGAQLDVTIVPLAAMTGAVEEIGRLR